MKSLEKASALLASKDPLTFQQIQMMDKDTPTPDPIDPSEEFYVEVIKNNPQYAGLDEDEKRLLADNTVYG